jgi:CspA family cold shock protein
LININKKVLKDDSQYQIIMSGSRSTGQVKWFNNKSGYGFITLLGETEVDIFVHHSAVSTTTDQFRYLVQGEYVQFSVMETEEGKKMAQNVRGIMEGKLMCEVRHEARSEPAPAPAVSTAE